MNAAGLHLEHEPIAFDSDEPEHVLARDEQAVIPEPGDRTIPHENAYIGRGERIKAGPPHIDPLLRLLRIPPRRLHLQAKEPSVFYMERKHLNSLPSGKRSHQSH